MQATDEQHVGAVSRDATPPAEAARPASLRADVQARGLSTRRPRHPSPAVAAALAAVAVGLASPTSGCGADTPGYVGGGDIASPGADALDATFAPPPDVPQEDAPRLDAAGMEDPGSKTTPDAAFDVTPDLAPDAPPDAPADVPADAPADVPPDVPADAATDGPADAAEDASTPPPTAGSGDVIFTEIMVNPAVVKDSDGEWFELWNATDSALDLSGCAVHDDGSQAFPLAPLLAAGAPDGGPALLAPGARWVFGRESDTALTDGLVPDFVYEGLGLTNTSDALILTCGDVEVDAVRWGTGDGKFPVESGHAMALSPSAPQTALSNDMAAHWCAASTPYGAANFGSPGLPNPPCPSEASAVDLCVLVEPLDATVAAGVSALAVGRVREGGATDETPWNDAIDGLAAEAGWAAAGPDGSLPPSPAQDADAWTWVQAVGTQGWVDTSAPGAVGEDQYEAALPGLPGGSYRVAFRFSLDDGQTWRLCDTTDGAGAEGFSVADAGRLTVEGSPCLPNPCTEPPAGLCLGELAQSFAPEGVCSVNAQGEPLCAYFQTITDCAASEGSCLDGACVGGPAAPGPGDVRVTELLPNPAAVSDALGEWVELTNVSPKAVDLTGCVLRDADSNKLTLKPSADGTPLIAPAGAALVLARSGAADANGLLAPPDYVYGSAMSLGNTADEVILECGGVVVDELWYDQPFLTANGTRPALAAAGVSMQLDPGAPWPATATDWCDAQTPFGAGDLGTPGGPNAPCPKPLTVARCRLEAPVDAAALQGSPVPAAGTVLVPGVTDLSPGLDVAPPDVRAELAMGPDGSDPTIDEAAWTFTPAVGDDAWDDAGAPGFDRVVAQLTAPAPGAYDVALRVSVDAGATWTYCDLPGSGPGQDGSEDGYQPALAGSLTVVPPPTCDPNPCTTPPLPVCQGDVVVSTEQTGTCDLPPGALTASCTYAQTLFDCAAWGGICQEGGAGAACVGLPPPPGAGEVAFTEILYDPDVPEEPAGEWFEVRNVGPAAVNLAGCTLTDGEGEVPVDAPLLLSPGASAVFGFADNAPTTGWSPDFVYGGGSGTASLLALANTGDELTLTCPEPSGGQPVLVDTVAYATKAPFPLRTPGVSIQLTAPTAASPQAAAANDDGTSWCLATTAYAGGDQGTPGADNQTCPAPEPVDRCRLVAPASAEVVEGDAVELVGQILEAGVTDQSDQVDASPALFAQAGWGPEGIDPSQSPDAWTFVAALPDGAWSASVAGQPGEDQYRVTVAAPSPVGEAQTFHLAFRFSADAGMTWTPCDLAAGPGSDGSEDGYQPANAGVLNVSAYDPCVPNPCTDAPPDACQGDVLTDYPAQGVCTAAAGVGACDYTPTSVDCAALGGSCAAGACVGTARPAAPGDLVITEIMFDPDNPQDSVGEWFEVTSVAPEPVNLGGCTVTDGEGAVEVLGPLLAQPGEALTFAATDQSPITGFTPDFLYGGGAWGEQIELLNTGDDVALWCPGQAGVATLVDRVIFDAGGGSFPAPVGGRSIQLDPGANDATANDDGALWCVAKAPYPNASGTVGVDVDWGSPGAPNPPCDLCAPNPCTDPPAATCSGGVWTGYTAVGDCTDLGTQAACTYQPTTVDCASLGGTCALTGCEGVPAAPAPGEAVFAEVLYDPTSPKDPGGEWFEVLLVADGPRLLTGCTVGDGEGEVPIDAPLIATPWVPVVFGYADNGAAGGVTPDFVYGGKSTTGSQVSLANAGDDLTLRCGDGGGATWVVDTLTYDDVGPFPSHQAGAAIALDPAAVTASAGDNEWGGFWCLASQLIPGGVDRGSPGVLNDPCDTDVDACQLVSPTQVAVAVGAPFTVTARVLEPALTGRSAGADATPLLLAQVGYGPQGSPPDGTWTWTTAGADPGWTDGAAPGWDQYVADLSVPAPGTVAVAARFSRDGGDTWLPCDLGGSGDGYDPSQAAIATIQ